MMRTVPVIPIGALLIGLVIGWRVEAWRSAAVHNAELARIAEATQAAELVARQTEQQRQTDIERIRTDASQQIEQARADADAAVASANGLREQANRLASRACKSTATATGSGSADSAALVLSDVLTRVDARAGELAAAYDRARIAGLACEQSYKAVSK